MAKPSKKPKLKDVETDPGAWDRFEHAVDAAVKSGPKHRNKPTEKSKQSPKRKKQKHETR